MRLDTDAKRGLVRKWASFRLDGGSAKVLNEVILESVGTGKAVALESALPGAGPTLSDPGSVQSHPVFFKGAFAGIEFPIASIRSEGGQVIFAYQPGLTVEPGQTYETRRMVVGKAKPGDEVNAFKDTIARLRPMDNKLHWDYNSWWTSPLPYSETDILKLMATFRDNLTTPYGARFDSFCIDLGWSEPKSLWDINQKLFPNRFTTISKSAEQMKSHLGLWVSPSNYYSPSSVDNAWLKEQGYEVQNASTWDGQPSKLPCLAGEKYREALKARLVEMVTQYGVRQFKFDGYRFFCNEKDHGHQPGLESADATAAGLISIAEAIHKASPDVWIETTCFGWNPAPWWLMSVNSVIGTYGDDAPFGRVPAPVYRQSSTTRPRFL